MLCVRVMNNVLGLVNVLLSQRLGHAVHGKRCVPPRALRESVGYSANGGWQTHRYCYSKSGPEEDDLHAGPGKAKGHGESDEQETPDDPECLRTDDIANSTEHMKQTSRGKSIHGSWP